MRSASVRGWPAKLLLIMAMLLALGAPAAAQESTQTILTSLQPTATSGNGGLDPCPATVNFVVKVFGVGPDFVNPHYGTFALFVDGEQVATEDLDPAMNGANFTITFDEAGTYEVYAVYTDGDDYAASTSPTVIQTIICGTGDIPTLVLLSPLADTNEVGDSHTVTATVTTADLGPAEGVVVRFNVTGVNSASGSDTTDASGIATFTYTGTNEGPDVITAYADTDGDGTQDVSEPTGVATKVWTAVPPPPPPPPPAPTMPTTKDECEKGGWEDYEGFKNQGDCVSYVVTGGGNPPDKE